MNGPLQSAPSAYSILIISTIVTGVVGPLATFFLRLFYNPDSSTDLALISDIVRFIFTWLGPFFPFGRSFLGWISVCIDLEYIPQSTFVLQIQEKNNRCVNQVTLDQLERICKLFTEAPDSYFGNPVNQNNNDTAACCDTKWGVSEEYSICGTLLPNSLLPFLPYPIHQCVEPESYWTFDYVYGINIDIIILTIDVFLFWTILTLLETNHLKVSWSKMKERYYRSSVHRPGQEDDDVQKEKDSVYSNKDNLMRVVNLTKRFARFEAVRGLTFGVRKNECFGLLGVNGAGKTTTFRYRMRTKGELMRAFTACRMITGDEVMTSGQCFIGDISLVKNRSQYLQSIGYCPQFDSIIEVSINDFSK